MADTKLGSERMLSHRRLYSTEVPVANELLTTLNKRPGQSAVEAAATAAFNAKEWVWVVDEAKGFVASWVTSRDGDLCQCMGVDDVVRSHTMTEPDCFV